MKLENKCDEKFLQMQNLLFEPRPLKYNILLNIFDYSGNLC